VTIQREGPGYRERRVRVGVFANMSAVLKSLDVDPGPIFKRTGFKVQQSNDPDRKMRYLQMTQLLAECVESNGGKHFGLLVGQSSSTSNYGVMGDVFLAAAAPIIFYLPVQ
jgi:hypothetical protein